MPWLPFLHVMFIPFPLDAQVPGLEPRRLLTVKSRVKPRDHVHTYVVIYVTCYAVRHYPRARLWVLVL